MKIGIIGSGVVGQQLGFGLIKLGHTVKIGSRNTSKLSDWLREAGHNASAGSFEETAGFGEVIILATLWAGTESAISMAGKENFRGKIVVDVTNPLDFSRGVPPKMLSAPGQSGGEKIQKWLPDAKVAKAFNTVSAYIMINPKLEEGDPVLFIAGNDEAKKFVYDTATAFGWIDIIDLGDISKSYLLEAFAQIWIEYGFLSNSWTQAFKLMRK